MTCDIMLTPNPKSKDKKMKQYLLNATEKFNVMGRLEHKQFLFSFSLFSDFIGFCFLFLFILDDEEARDISVT